MPLNQQQYNAIAQALRKARDSARANSPSAPSAIDNTWYKPLCNNIADILQADAHARFNRRKFLEDAGAQ